MNRRLNTWSLLVAVSFLFICATAAQAQRPILGGYKETDKSSDAVQGAAEFAVAEQGRKDETTIKLVSVQKAESQGVAMSTNYRICMKVEVEGKGDDADATIEVQAEVNMTRDGKYTLRNWANANCPDDDDDGGN